MAVAKVQTASGETRYEVRARDAHGVNQKRRFEKRRDADKYDRQLADEREAARNGERPGSSENPTLAEWIDSYLGSHVAAPQTIRALADRLKVVRNALGDAQLRDLDEVMIGRWVREDLDGYASTQQRALVKALRQVLAAAVRREILRKNPASEVRLPSLTRPSMQPFRSWAEVETVAEKAGKWGDLILFGAATGLRLQELFALKWRDVDREARTLKVQRAVRNKRIAEGEAKTAGSLRTIVLSDRALDALPIDEAGPDDLIFAGPDGRLVDLHNWRSRTWYPALKAAGLATRGPKNLRHTFATLTLTTTAVGIQDIARMLGHKDIAVTLQHYAAWMPEQDDRLLRQLNASADNIRPLPVAREAAA